MVGGGVNDAPALAGADVSFTMGEGSEIALANADAILLGARLTDVAIAPSHWPGGRHVLWVRICSGRLRITSLQYPRR
jgi:hypothetical protein